MNGKERSAGRPSFFFTFFRSLSLGTKNEEESLLWGRGICFYFCPFFLSSHARERRNPSSSTWPPSLRSSARLARRTGEKTRRRGEKRKEEHAKSFFFSSPHLVPTPTKKKKSTINKQKNQRRRRPTRVCDARLHALPGIQADCLRRVCRRRR